MNKSTRNFRRGIVLIVVVLCFHTAAEAFPRDVRWRQLETEHFTFFFAEQHQPIVQDVAGMAEALHQQLAEFLEYTEEVNTPVIITHESDIFLPYDLRHIQDPAKDPILLSLGQPEVELPVFAANLHNELLRQFISQYSFIMRHKMDGWLRTTFAYLFPDNGYALWMDGGMAALMEFWLNQGSRLTFVEMFLRTEVLENLPFSLAQQSARGRRSWPEDLGGVVYGYAFLSYLTEKFGAEELAQLNRRQSRTIPWPFFGSDAFEQVYGKDFETLYQEWRQAITRAYQGQLEQLRSRPITPTQSLSSAGYWTNSPVFSPDGLYVYYIEDSGHDDPALMQVRLADMQKTQLAEGKFSGSFSLSADGQQLVLCKTEPYKMYYERSDLYLLDISTRKMTRLTRGAGAFDPVLSPDGASVVYAATLDGTMSLHALDLASGEQTVVLGLSDGSQIRHPAFSSDGRRLAFQLQKPGETEDIYVLDRENAHLTRITSDPGRDMLPAWGTDDTFLFFSSDRTGVPNILAYSWQDQSVYQVTHVLTGAFAPAVSPDGSQLALEYYSAHGMEIHLASCERAEWRPVAVEAGLTAQNSAIPVSSSVDSSESGYNPFPSLVPDYLPVWGEDEEGFQLGLSLTGQDHLEQHTYGITLLYGFDSQRLEVEAEYLNDQFYPTIRLFGYDRSELYSDLFRNPRGGEEDYWERQQGGGLELLIPVFRSRRSDWYLTAGYEYSLLDHLTDMNELLAPLPDDGALASVSAGLLMKSFDRYRYSISPESGMFALLEYERNDELFGSDFNIHKAIGEVNVYLNSFFKRHVIALKAAGGLSDGDTLTQGVFQLGGYGFGLETDIWYEPQLFLRGYETNSFAGDRVAVGTLEYRFPLWFPQHPLWGGRIFWDSLAGSVFVESGDAWDHSGDPEFKSSAGAELLMQYGFRYGQLPLRFGIGFAHGFDEDEGENQIYFTLKLTL